MKHKPKYNSEEKVSFESRSSGIAMLEFTVSETPIKEKT